MIAQILKSPPLSGSIDEILFDAFGTCGWVKFSNECEEWVGVFGNGGVDQVVVFNSGQHAFVITGSAYLVDLSNKSLIKKIDNRTLDCAMIVPEQDLVVMTADGNALMFCDFLGNIWEHEWDMWEGYYWERIDDSNAYGMEINFVTKEQVYGEIWIETPPDDTDTKYSFTYNISKRTFKILSVIDTR